MVYRALPDVHCMMLHVWDVSSFSPSSGESFGLETQSLLPLQPEEKYIRRTLVPPVTCEATLGSLQQLTTLKRLSLDFAEGIGNAEMQYLRLPSSLKVCC